MIKVQDVFSSLEFHDDAKEVADLGNAMTVIL